MTVQQWVDAYAQAWRDRDADAAAKARVSSFSFTSSASRAVSHSCGETIGCMFITFSFLTHLATPNRAMA
jgi:hypothetical protein